MRLEVRRLGVGDAELLQEACRGIRAETVGLRRCREWLANPANVVVVARRDGALCGWVNGYRLQRFSCDELFLFEVDTVPAHRRRGVATALVGALKAVCREQGIDGMFVLTSASNGPAMALYGRTGATCEGHDRDVMWTWEGLAAARQRAGRRRDAGEG
jgi:GNAT superfamily N-acetyltransferase